MLTENHLTQSYVVFEIDNSLDLATVIEMGAKLVRGYWEGKVSWSFVVNKERFAEFAPFTQNQDCILVLGPALNRACHRKAKLVWRDSTVTEIGVWQSVSAKTAGTLDGWTRDGKQYYAAL